MRKVNIKSCNKIKIYLYNKISTVTSVIFVLTNCKSIFYINIKV